MNDKLTLGQAGALAAILGAAERNATVARVCGGTWHGPAYEPSVVHAEARYIGGQWTEPRDFAAEKNADVRDLFLIVRITAESNGKRTDVPWLVRDLISEYLAGTFVTDFDTAAFEAAGGQAAVPASMAACEAAQARPADGITRLAGTIGDVTGTDADTAEWLAIGVFQVLAVMKLESQLKPVLSGEQVNAAYRRAGEIKDSETARPYKPGELIEYVSHSSSKAGQWVPGIFRSYPDGVSSHVTVQALADAVRGKAFSYLLLKQNEIRRIDPATVSAARSWIADCEWANLTGDDVTDLTGVQVIAGIQRHYSGGWAQFTADGDAS